MSDDIRPCLDCGAPVRMTETSGNHLDERLDDTHTPHVARIRPTDARTLCHEFWPTSYCEHDDPASANTEADALRKRVAALNIVAGYVPLLLSIIRSGERLSDLEEDIIRGHLAALTPPTAEALSEYERGYEDGLDARRRAIRMDEDTPTQE